MYIPEACVGEVWLSVEVNYAPMLKENIYIQENRMNQFRQKQRLSIVYFIASAFSRSCDLFKLYTMYGWLQGRLNFEEENKIYTRG